MLDLGFSDIDVQLKSDFRFTVNPSEVHSCSSRDDAPACYVGEVQCSFVHETRGAHADAVGGPEF